MYNAKPNNETNESIYNYLQLPSLSLCSRKHTNPLQLQLHFLQHLCRRFPDLRSRQREINEEQRERTSKASRSAVNSVENSSRTCASSTIPRSDQVRRYGFRRSFGLKDIASGAGGDCERYVGASTSCVVSNWYRTAKLHQFVSRGTKRKGKGQTRKHLLPRTTSNAQPPSAHPRAPQICDTASRGRLVPHFAIE